MILILWVNDSTLDNAHWMKINNNKQQLSQSLTYVGLKWDTKVLLHHPFRCGQKQLDPVEDGNCWQLFNGKKPLFAGIFFMNIEPICPHIVPDQAFSKAKYKYFGQILDFGISVHLIVVMWLRLNRCCIDLWITNKAFKTFSREFIKTSKNILIHLN